MTITRRTQGGVLKVPERVGKPIKHPIFTPTTLFIIVVCAIVTLYLLGIYDEAVLFAQTIWQVAKDVIMA